MIQSILTISIICIAAGYLGYLFYQKFIKKEASCDGCAVGNQEQNK